ncbi:MAG: tRNA lysidine(34) synthetase TilS [Verrucomicrobiales bacterium]|nr:tRNA lysidine(34) synthetase TilS [Verrucomicrobiales bacterium]
MSNLIERVERTIRSRDLVKEGEKLLVAVSGGLDSMVLLSLLHRLAPRHGWQLQVAHFNHRLRGKNSAADERWVRNSAKRLRIPAVTDRDDARAFAEREKISIEMAARRLRHEFLARTARRHRIRSVALAHQADDQVELFFLRLFRGAGGEGLAGMKWSGPSPADPNVQLIRPLLDISRAELEFFARAESISFREDATNAELDFERNRVRHALLPSLRVNFSVNVDKTILRSMEIIGVESEFTNESARSWLDRKTPGEFGRLHLAVQRRALHVQLLERGIAPEFELIERLRTASNLRVTVARTRTIWRDADGLIQESGEKEAQGLDTREISLVLAGRSGELSFDGCAISWRISPGSNRAWTLPPRSPGREYFDARQVGRLVRVRHWWPGDRFVPIGLSKPVKLQDWFVNQKVPRRVRHELILAGTESGEIFWVEGLRIGEAFKITKQTKDILEWRWSRERFTDQ